MTTPPRRAPPGPADSVHCLRGLAAELEGPYRTPSEVASGSLLSEAQRSTECSGSGVSADSTPNLMAGLQRASAPHYELAAAAAARPFAACRAQKRGTQG